MSRPKKGTNSEGEVTSPKERAAEATNSMSDLSVMLNILVKRMEKMEQRMDNRTDPIELSTSA